MTSPLHPPTGSPERCAGAKSLAWMVSLSIAAGEHRAAEAYLMEMLAWCAFGERGPTATPAS